MTDRVSEIRELHQNRDSHDRCDVCGDLWTCEPAYLLTLCSELARALDYERNKPPMSKAGDGPDADDLLARPEVLALLEGGTDDR